MRSHRSRWPEPRSTAITGAGSGIGRALAVRLAKPGHCLALIDRDAHGLATTSERCRQLGAIVGETVADVTNEAALSECAERTAEHFGGIDAVCNVAGIINAGTVEQSTVADIQLIMDTNFGGVVNGTKAFLPHVIESGSGVVVNVSSAYGGLIAGPAYSAYCASKAAIRAWTDTLRIEMQLDHPDTMRVITVYPGGVHTPIMAASTSAAGPADAAARRDFFDNHVARSSPEKVAEKIVTAISRGRRHVLVGADAMAADALARMGIIATEALIVRANRTKGSR